MDVVKISKAIADPLRWEILKRIATKNECCGESTGLCVCHLVEDMKLLQSKVSYHIKELKEADLIREESSGRWHFYYLQEETFRMYLNELQRQLIP